MIYPAHIKENEVQTVQAHCQNTAKYAAESLQCIGLSSVGYLAGLMHDMGKFTSSFKEYIEKASSGENVKRGSVVHSHAAARYILERYHDPNSFKAFRDMTSELVAYSVAAHHGVFDCVDKDKKYGFDRRLAWDESYEQAKTEFLRQCADEKTIDDLFEAADKELTRCYIWANSQTFNNGEEIFFHLGLLARLILSSVINGDRRDTSEFESNKIVDSIELDSKKWGLMLKRVEGKIEKLASSSPLDGARQEISRLCRKAADNVPGLYRLNVPTGAGKTLSSLRFALAHAEKYRKSRIVFTSPLLSILEQNSEIIRNFIEDDGAILEHHSNVVRTQQMGDELDRRELLEESWDPPIIITTMVQLLNCLFDGKTSSIRRFQALCNSIIVIDEVQTIPVHMLSLFNMAVDFLINVCQCTLVLCSATQPFLEATCRPIQSVARDMVSYDKELWKSFERTFLVDGGAMKLDDIPYKISEVLENSCSLLVVCNMKGQARKLYNKLLRQDTACFHLSAGMCPAHRRDTIAALKSALEEARNGGKKVLCIATQVIEAGVDISFGRVLRLVAGMDNAVQSAGRENRNREYEYAVPTLLINCSDEKLDRLRTIQDSKLASLQLLSAYRKDPDKFGSLASDMSIRYYYRCLYDNMPQHGQDYPLKNGNDLFDLLSVNMAYSKDMSGKERFCMRQAFAEAGKAFKVFDQETTAVIVPYGKGKKLIKKLRREQNYEKQKQLLSEVKPYVVPVFKYQLEMLDEQGAIMQLLDGAALELRQEYYDGATGLISRFDIEEFLEV